MGVWNFAPGQIGRLSWPGIEFPGPISVGVIARRDQASSGDSWMVSLRSGDGDINPGELMWNFEFSGVSELATFGPNGLNSRFDSSLESLGEVRELWFCWSGEPFTSTTAHWRNLTSDPFTWHHATDENASWANDVLRTVPGDLFVGEQFENVGSPGVSNFIGSIAAFFIFAADLWDGGNGPLGFDPFHSSTSAVQDLNTGALRVAVDLTEEDATQLVDLAGYGVQGVSFNGALDSDFSEWTNDGIPVDPGGGDPGESDTSLMTAGGLVPAVKHVMTASGPFPPL